MFNKHPDGDKCSEDGNSPKADVHYYIHTYIARGPDMFVGLAQDDKDTTERTLLATNRYTVWKAPTHILLACVSMISLSIIILRFLACTK